MKHSHHQLHKKVKSIAASLKGQTKSVLVTGSRFTSFDQLRQRHFWSSYYFAPDANGYIAAQNYPVFVTPSGNNGQGFPSGVVLSDRETNWKSQNRVPDNQNFEITEIGVSLGVVTSDILANSTATQMQVSAKTQYQFLNNMLVNITYLTNSVPLGLCADFAQASGPHPGAVAAAFPGNQKPLVRTNGFPAPALRRRFKIPILLQHGETFAFSFQVPRSFYIGTTGVVDGSVTDVNNAVVARFDFWATESFVEKS